MATLTLPKWAESSSNIYTDIIEYQNDEERNLGYQPNTTVNSKIMNTVLHAHDNILIGLCNAFNEYYDGENLTLMSNETKWKEFFESYISNVDDKFTNEKLTITENASTGDILTFTNGKDVEYKATITNSKHSVNSDSADSADSANTASKVDGGSSGQFYKSNGTNGEWSTVSSTRILRSTSTSNYTNEGAWNDIPHFYELHGATFSCSSSICQIGLCHGSYGYGLLIYMGEYSSSVGSYLLIGNCTALTGATISLTWTTLSSELAGTYFLNE